MHIIIDSNVLFSALIKDSLTRKIILDYDGELLFPVYIFQEYEKHRKELIKRSGMQNSEILHLINLVLRKVAIVPNDVLDSYKDEAFKIIKDIDPDDILFIACALAYENSIIWSDDKKLKNQSRVKILNTGEIIKLIYS
ncbi:MAG: PIN domain-containing protein [Nanoarchaeota archaeon]